MTLRAVTSADLSWELSVIIYPAVFHRAKLMQFCPRKEGSTSFQLNHDENMGKGNSNVDVLPSLYSWLRHRKRFVLYSVHILIKLTACCGQLLLARSTRLRVQPPSQLCESAVTLNSC